MKTVILILQAVLVSQLAMASNYGVGGGVRTDSASSNTSGTNIGSSTNYMAGVIGQMDLVAQLQARAGFFYTQRSYQFNPLGGAQGAANFTYLDVPLGLLWKLSDYGGPFIGANFALNVSASCPGTCTGVSSMPMGWQLGAQFKFAPEWGAALYYESMSVVMTGIDQPKAIAAQLFYMY